jgi:Icc-related predicted phosphoesterase
VTLQFGYGAVSIRSLVDEPQEVIGMRIYSVADIHSRAERFSRIRRNIEAFEPDLLVVAGDLCSYINPRHVVPELYGMAVPVLAIRGNSDPRRVDDLLENHPNTTSLHLKQVIVDGTAFVGVSGTIPVPFRTRMRLREKRLRARLESILNKESVLVTHPPPFGTLDEVFGEFHAGSSSLCKMISICQPRVLICGHIHEGEGTAFIGNTLVVNCSMGRGGSGAIIDLENGRPAKAQILPRFR